MLMTVPLIWLFVIRPYCVKHGRGYTLGANVGVTIWVDWQQARELAQMRADRRMLFWCRAFLVIQMVWLALLLLVILAASLVQ